MTYQDIKSYLGRENLVSLLEALGYEFNRQGSFAIREEKTPSTTIRPADLYIKDHGGDFGGDVFDLLKQFHSMDDKKAKAYVMNFLGLSDDTDAVPIKRKISKPMTMPKDNQKLMAALAIKANKYLFASPQRVICGKGHPVSKWGYFTLEIEDKDGKIKIDEVIRVAPVFEKLFEGHIVPTDKKFAKYLFDKVIGYDPYFNCPVIIIRDESEKVVDIVRYRPERDGKPLDMKYLYTKSEEKPDSVYLFPLQAQMQRMMIDQGYCYVGEGLKNAINASMQGVPFISIEGAGSIKPALIKFLQSDRMKSIVMIGAFDGDTAGERAYKKINAEIPMDNEFDFTSGIDFAEYLKELQ